MTNHSITAFDGVRVGIYTQADGLTGCAVAAFDRPNVAAAEVRGAAPGSRELAALAPGASVQGVDAIVLTGGSALGLGAADGVAQALRADGVGFDTKFGAVPIVPAAVVYDLQGGGGAPDASDGAAAYRAASTAPVPSGPVGPGAGCTISKWRDASQPGGLGNGLATVGGVSVAALVVVNATGDLFALDGTAVTGGPHRPGAPAAMAYGENTTLALVVTDAPLARTDLGRLIVRAHDAFGTCIRPAHTRYDGDICFAVSTGGAEPDSTLLDAAGEAAYAAVGHAIVDAVGGAGS